MIDRRQFLQGIAAVGAAAALPLAAAPAVAEAPTPAWVVGTPGEYNWEFVLAKNEHEAKLEWIWSQLGDAVCDVVDSSDPEKLPEDCDCDFCCRYHDIDADRKPKLDGQTRLTADGWLNAGMGHICSRCGHETSRDDGARAIGDDAVCCDCLTSDEAGRAGR